MERGDDESELTEHAIASVPVPPDVYAAYTRLKGELLVADNSMWIKRCTHDISPPFHIYKSSAIKS